jgi:23S rRNA (cytosine1962-C5)-methyltransferase
LNDDYQLIDYGDGRKLERFGELLIDRPSPAAGPYGKRDAAAWGNAHARFERDDDRSGSRQTSDDTGGESHSTSGRWITTGQSPAPWTQNCGLLRLELKLTPQGQLGVFPEQAENWRWLQEQVRRCASPPRVLNLFAYTGAATLAAAAAGAHVTHVDAARNIVAWARRNAELSGLAAAPIRWIVEDALRFVRREQKRASIYDAVILDPPSFGRGPRGQTWKLERDLPELLDLCGALTAGHPRFLLLSCHTPGYDAARLHALLAQTFSLGASIQIESAPLLLADPTGRTLPSGHMARLSDKPVVGVPRW